MIFSLVFCGQITISNGQLGSRDHEYWSPRPIEAQTPQLVDKLFPWSGHISACSWVLSFIQFIMAR